MQNKKWYSMFSLLCIHLHHKTIYWQMKWKIIQNKKPKKLPTTFRSVNGNDIIEQCERSFSFFKNFPKIVITRMFLILTFHTYFFCSTRIFKKFPKIRNFSSNPPETLNFLFVCCCGVPIVNKNRKTQATNPQEHVQVNDRYLLWFFLKHETLQG